MNEFIRHTTPLLLALLLGLIGVAAVLISQGGKLIQEADHDKRRQAAYVLLLGALAPSLCRSAFSYDIWAVTALFASDPKTITYYNLTDKHSAVQLLIVIHLILFLFVQSWGGLVWGESKDTKHLGTEIGAALIAVVLCVAFQAY